ncbi:hypothetical protein CAOG_008314 [Capsaspora owczarzaki ATCC 30864]|uniref:Uncharacterized protein n=1 Tax=Capsaspora owczarzaki (strain ATCC 30864) TaxID=595528 RepID=A0A0D2W1W9_CAPO3|nr:hypothetical protein CAOG_008314 [Capsaspora owczarzaki ATCC 30864]
MSEELKPSVRICGSEGSIEMLDIEHTESGFTETGEFKAYVEPTNREIMAYAAFERVAKIAMNALHKC